MTNKTRLRIVCGGLIVLLAGLWLLRPTGIGQRTNSPTPRPMPTQDNSLAITDPDASGRLLALEARRGHWNHTVWTNELLAQKHEDLFVGLWDQLRIERDACAVLTNFSFGSLRLGDLSAPSPSDHGIAIRRFASPFRLIQHAEWPGLLEQFQQQGCRLEQSEWRHRRFVVATNGTAHSVIALTLHVFNSETKERHIVRGDLRVAWRKPASPNDEPFPELIDASGLEFLSRRGETPFHHVIAADLTPEKSGAAPTEPSLQLYDLDGDGFSEIIFANRNQVYWNQQQGIFKPDRLFAYPLAAVKAGLVADFDHDGQADFLAADTQGLALFAGDPRGRFLKPPKRIRFQSEELPNPQVMTAGDIDGDGDLDVWLAQYKVPYQGGQMPTPFFNANDGHPAFLLINDGQGNFQDRTEFAGLAAKRFRRTYSSSFADLDEDGDLDLLVVSDFGGADLYFNDGHGRFTDVTAHALDEPRCFGMAHTIGDFDLDGHADCFVIGMNSFAASRMDATKANPPGFPDYGPMRSKMAYGNRLFLWRGGFLRQTPIGGHVAESGWSWGVTSGDFDNDGDLDIYVVNGHISGPSAKDYEPQFWQHDIYAGTSREDPVADKHLQTVRTRYQGAGFSYGGYEKNRLFLNLGGKAFLEAGYLMGVSLEQDCRNAVSDDLDGDGKPELLVTTFQAWPKMRQELHLFPNFAEKSGNWIGIRLRESGPGFSPLGAKVNLTLTSGNRIRQFVTGDSYRSQHANTAHFGIGRSKSVEILEVVWPNGRSKAIRNPAINTYHSIKPDRQ